MYRIKKIHILPLAYTLTLIYLVIGVVASILLVLAKIYSIPDIDPKLTTLPYYAILLIYPLGYAIAGFATGIIIGALYNFSTKLTKGITLEFKKNK